MVEKQNSQVGLVGCNFETGVIAITVSLLSPLDILKIKHEKGRIFLSLKSEVHRPNFEYREIMLHVRIMIQAW